MNLSSVMDLILDSHGILGNTLDIPNGSRLHTG
jgi:hypothetical protein